jgi:hypothetical protein
VARRDVEGDEGPRAHIAAAFEVSFDVVAPRIKANP